MAELACGSGRWTRLLGARGRSVTGVDAAPEMLALARERVRDLPVELIQANLFAWEPPRRYDTVFFASSRARAGERFLPDQATPAVWRRLRDGSEHRVVKVYHSPAGLAARMAELGWSAEVRETSTPLLVGTARRGQAAPQGPERR